MGWVPSQGDRVDNPWIRLMLLGRPQSGAPTGGQKIEQKPYGQEISGGGGGGGGGAPAGGGGWSEAWGDYAKIQGMLGDVMGGARNDFGNLASQYQSVKSGIGQAFNKVRKQYDKDLAGMPSLDLRLPGSMGGGDLPMAPGKWSDMYSSQASTRGNLLNSKYGNVLNALTGKGNTLGNEYSTLLGATGQLGDLLHGQNQYDLGLQNIGLGYAGLANNMAMAQGGWGNNLALQQMRNDQGDKSLQSNDYWRQQALNDQGGSSWLPWLQFGGSLLNTGLQNSDKIAGWFA